MPILLDDIANTKLKNIYTAKFFDKKLTGVGKKGGLLNETRNPENILPTQKTEQLNVNLSRKRKYTNGQTDVLMLPINILTADAWDLISKIECPDLTKITKISDKNGTANATEVYVDMTVHSLVSEEVTLANAAGGPTKKLTACYQLFVYVINDTTSKECFKTATKGNTFISYMTCNPTEMLLQICQKLLQNGHTVNNQAVADFIKDYSLYDAIVKQSEKWQTQIDDVLGNFFESVVASHYDKASLNIVAEVLRRIEDYNVPLDLYKSIYNHIKNYFKPDDAVILCKQNLNLLLSDTLNNLSKNKNLLSKIPAPTNPINIPKTVANFSTEQMKAIATTEPLTLVQAGAGTGKSTVILGRMAYMASVGIDPKDITVLSFTNAAADNITAKNPNVKSMTIARMIHTIYSANFTTHELSSIETIMNSLDIYFPNNALANKFKFKLKDIAKNESDGFTSMNNFIEYNYDEIIKILDTIKQTSLELEIIICYQKIDMLIEPPEITSKYLIIDEVQDNSIFEFIYTLKYVDKHKESLFIVGDCSQTLFEFRAANPRALNVLEGSGVFTAYQLQVNYRSNQEILDFANVALQNIEANQYAHIQLQANSFNPVTEKSFKEKVNFKYERLSGIRDFNDKLVHIINTDVRPYIEEKLAAGEQVAFIAFTRKHVKQIEETLKEMYPDKTVASLVPEKIYNSTIFSEFIKRYWSEVNFIPTKSIIPIIAQDVIGKLPYIVQSAERAEPACKRQLANWRNDQTAIINSWQTQLMNGQMTKDVFLDNVKESMLQFEIRNNAIKQALLSARNEQNKKNQNLDSANFLLSTIHSAKGLEFENVVVIYRNEASIAEDKKRMYYVAFTRAMKSEYIVAYDTTACPQIEADYNSIIKMLHDKDAANAKKNSMAAVTAMTDPKETPVA